LERRRFKTNIKIITMDNNFAEEEAYLDNVPVDLFGKARRDYKQNNLNTIPNNTLPEDVRLVLLEAKDQIEYLHQKFTATGSGNQVLAKIVSLINRLE
jgi:hypothetical protein